MKKYSTASVWPERNSLSPLIEDARRGLPKWEQNGLKRGLNELMFTSCARSLPAGIERVPTLEQEDR